METIEKIDVYIRVKDGRTVCICCTKNGKCSGTECHKEHVYRDRFEDWKKTMNNRYGK